MEYILRLIVVGSQEGKYLWLESKQETYIYLELGAIWNKCSLLKLKLLPLRKQLFLPRLVKSFKQWVNTALTDFCIDLFWIKIDSCMSPEHTKMSFPQWNYILHFFFSVLENLALPFYKLQERWVFLKITSLMQVCVTVSAEKHFIFTNTLGREKRMCKNIFLCKNRWQPQNCYLFLGLTRLRYNMDWSIIQSSKTI